MHVCVRVRAPAPVRACVPACLRACVRARICFVDRFAVEALQFTGIRNFGVICSLSRNGMFNFSVRESFVGAVISVLL